ncbi:DUF2712 domain-containing protein [Fictibacillus sp. 26RED30]|uniref:DUF2712 domain-containing protein n=1 Tax=Fictibacillus sp. 26RED30 TaxID=2745877 RepID=UPI0018CFDCDF|nr:DUF2712 domain-containing protein [Fictibacillus sp. 26RED30]MBH0161835.1 DUF2712 domain-containing protein [Fictibacillus sp. 26RED30]
MKKTIKKYYRVGLAGVMGITLLTAGNVALASNDNVEYSFSLKPEHGNSYSKERYRQTTDTSNKWKVNYSYSSEGKGTVATYWLDKSGTRVSDTHDVAQGSGAKYYTAFSTANQKDVRLGVENNNYTTSGFTASGYWDEEIN